MAKDDFERGFDRAHSSWQDGYASELGSSLYDAARACVPALLALLDDADPKVRANAIALLGHVSESAAEIAPALAAHLARETGPAAGASTVLALYFVARYAPSTQPLTQEALTRALDSGQPLVAGLAFAASTLLEGTPPSGRDATGLLRGMLIGLEPYGAMRGYANPLDPAEVFGWDFAPNDWALSLLGRQELGLRPLLTDAIVGAARMLQGRSCGNLSAQLIALPLSWLVPTRARSQGFLAPSELAAEARAGLERLSEIDAAGPFVDYGLSPEVRSRRRQLGLDPAGPLKHLVRVEGVTGDEAWPIWRVVIELLRVREEPWEAVHEKLVAAAPELRPRDWLAVWFEIYGSKQSRLAAHTYAYGELWNQQSADVTHWVKSPIGEGRAAIRKRVLQVAPQSPT